MKIFFISFCENFLSNRWRLISSICFFVQLSLSLFSSSPASAAASDCIEAGGQAVCSKAVPKPWVYNWCHAYVTGGGNAPAQAYCIAAGGVFDSSKSPACSVGAAVIDESNLTSFSTTYLNLLYTGCGLSNDSGWGQNGSGACYSGNPAYQGDILYRDNRFLTFSCTGRSEVIQTRRMRSLGCPAGSSMRTIDGYTACVRPVEPLSCGVGNPITPGTGTKIQVEQDDIAFGESFVRHYNPFGSLIPYSAGMSQAKQFGDNWRSNFDYRIYPITGSSYVIAAVSMPDGSLQYFNQQGKPLQNYGISDESLTQSGGGYIYSANNRQYIFDLTGKLTAIKLIGGITRTLMYSDGTAGAGGGYALYPDGTPSNIVLPAGLLLTVVDSFGRAMIFGYDAINRVVKLVDPENHTLKYNYDTSGNLTSVTYPDGKTRTYIYNESTFNGGVSQPYALTGIIDENGTRFATWKYDTLGRAISSEHNLPNNQKAEKVSIAYATDANGNVISSEVKSHDLNDVVLSSRTYSFTNILGVVKNTGVTQPCNSGCGTNSATTYDINGNVASKTDFNGNITNYIYDLNRNLETSRTEAYGTSKARTITTQWHATYRLPTLITESGRTTAFTYDTNGNQLTKTITDTALNKSRTWTYTYNTLGQVLTVNGPRTDVNDVTTYTYYPSASSVAGSVHSIGDLATVTNAVGHITSITNYDLNGRPLSITDANGVVTTLEYWPRGWLKSRTVNGVQKTTYDYDGAGQLIQITLPDNSALKYTYDTAHRLTDIEDGYVVGSTLTLSGNKIHYTLDAMGNRTQEDTRDVSVIRKTQSRAFNSLNQLWKDIGGTSPSTQITEYGYDNNGNLKTITDPLNHITTNGYDALNRLITVTDAANGVSTTGYNARDQVTQVKDARLVTTDYTVDGLGNVTLTQSPDSGNTNTVYDTAGNVIQKTDARGVVSTYAYDALNRLTQIEYPSDYPSSVYFYYDEPSSFYSKGRLSTLYYGNTHEMLFSYDAYGNLKSQIDWIVLSDGNYKQFASSYLYDTANRLQRITYGNTGRRTIYTRNALGQITQVQTQDTSTAPLVTVVSNISYEPFGPIKGLTFGNNVTTTIQHDADYRTSRIATTANPVWDFEYSYDNAGNLLTALDLGEETVDSKYYAYDNLNRVTADYTWIGYQYQYDAGGNRLKREQWPYAPIAQEYAATSNRATSYNGTAMTADTAGNITQRSTLSLSYDAANRLKQSIKNSVTTTYQYNGLGWRNAKQNSALTHYDYTPDGKLLAQVKLNTDNTYNQIIEYLWLDNTPIAQIKTTYAASNVVSTRRLTYIHTDHLNTPRIMTDANKTVVWKWHGDAYGFIAPNSNPDGDGTTDTLDLRFPGQIYDAESGLFYNLNRYYDPLTGRYPTSDPIGLAGGLNTYSYSLNNPVRYSDPYGLFVGDPATWTPAAAAIAEAGVGVAARSAAGVGGLLLPQRIGEDPVPPSTQCPGPDDCAAILAKIDALAGEIRSRHFQMLIDPLNLYERAFCSPNLGKRRGTWLGHENAIRNLVKGLKNAIDEADAKRCPVDPQDRALLGVTPPSCPAR